MAPKKKGAPLCYDAEIDDYLNRQMRPYNCQNIVDNLHKKFTKKQVQDALDKLVSKGAVRVKMFGKCGVYCTALPPVERNIELEHVTESLETKCEALTQEYQVLKKRQRLYRSNHVYDAAREIKLIRNLLEAKTSKLQRLNELVSHTHPDTPHPCTSHTSHSGESIGTRGRRFCTSDNPKTLHKEIGAR